MSTDMDTFSARLASFDTVLKPERRSSTTKGSKTIGWPHHSPSPAELAHAGFYYKPYETNPDNTTCFQCNRALDGWEEEDNPITEHLKHSPDCGWAIIMDIQQRSSNPATIEDPTSDRITQARFATFGAAWPHDGKRGWVCQSEKMVEGGWYFCPNEESNDLASCPYCKLSLDGWEPKDDPFDEHYRRSSDCSFFVFAQPPAKKGKGSKSKKGRTSKASSRLSTQSVATITSEAPEIDVDESMDQSMVSQATVKPKASKKGTKGKSKSSKSKKEEVEVESQMDVDEIELIQPEAEPEPVKPKRGTKGKKRVSEEMSNDEPEAVQEDFHESPPPPAEPPAKRRATKTRSSSISQAYQYDLIMADAGSVDEAPQGEPAKKARKKKGASKSHKASDVSVSSKTTSKTRVPRDSELEAALEAGLDADIPEPAEEEREPEPDKPRASKKNKGGKKAKAAAESPEPRQEPEESDLGQELQPDAPMEPDVPETEEHPVLEEPEEPEETIPKSKPAKASKKKGSKKSKKEESSKALATQDSSEIKSAAEDRHDSDRHESFVSVEIINKESESRREPETEPEEKVLKKKSSKKDVKAKKSKKTKKTEETPPPEPAPEQRDVRSPSRDDDDVLETPDDIPDQVEMVAAPRAPSPEPSVAHERTPVPAKTTKRFSDIPQEEHLAQSFSESQGSGRKEQSKLPRTSRSSNRANRAVSPLPTAHLSTPSMSPQSSDAENHPPSSRPSTAGPAVPSASKELKPRTPLVASTPSPSKRNANAGFPPSAHPWTPVDIDEVLFGEASDKENADLASMFKNVKGTLTSPEKKMTVEEWIMWNAKNGEERLKRECERLVGQFEKEGGRAMQRLEAIECMD